MAVDRISCDGPEPALLVAERVFEQHGVFVERLLNFRGGERLRPDERGVSRAGLTNLQLDQLQIGGQGIDLFRQGLGLIGGVPFVERLSPGQVLGVEPLLQRAAFFEQRRIYALTYLGPRFRQQVQQPARPRALADLESEPVIAGLWIRPVRWHEKFGEFLVIALQAGSKGIFQRMRTESETLLLGNAKRGFKKLARLI